jgi:leucyl-tRNA synthetase
MESRLLGLHRHMDEFDLRSYVNEVYFETPQDLRWYLRRGGRNRKVVMAALDKWIPLMAPVTPHIAEEMWESIGRRPFVSQVQLPPGSLSDSVVLEEAKERLVMRLLDDVTEIVKVTNIKPTRIAVMTSPKWKHEMLAEALAMGKPDVSALIKKAMAGARTPEEKKEVPAYAKGVSMEIAKTSAEDRRAMAVTIDELEVLNGARPFLQKEFSCDVQVFSASDPARVDPKGKAKFAKPGRPAVYIE